jgi:N-acetyl-anhydromuramyl-L-alanine amidase AmpD
VEAFQRRFLPDRINGIIDAKVYVRIINISENT